MSVVKLDFATDANKFGGKAANLAKLLQNGLPVPDGWAVGLDAFTEKGGLSLEAKDEITGSLNDVKLYAVRSSALAEDADDTSWAGQFETFLNVETADILTKIEQCHNSAKDRARAYAEGGRPIFVSL